MTFAIKGGAERVEKDLPPSMSKQNNLKGTIVIAIIAFVVQV